jgi:rSAM/selenodomain-associated transferase 2
VKVSVIVPTYNEERGLEAALDALRTLPGDLEVLVVDGGSDDATVDILRRSGVSWFRGAHSRALQMNMGAFRAKGDTLLFLHADTRLPRDAHALVERALAKPETQGGCFCLRFEGTGIPLRLYERLARLPRRSFHFGDEAFFVRASVFARLGGFHPLPIMEDLDFWRRMRRNGPVRMIGTPVVTSARRFLQGGLVRQQAINISLLLAYMAGVSPVRLKRYYDEVR